MPSPTIQSKYIYFYNPYNYEVNTKKFLRFDSFSDNNDKNFSTHRRTNEISGWKKIRDFFHDSDKKTYDFSIKQLRRRLNDHNPDVVKKMKRSSEERQHKYERIESLFNKIEPHLQKSLQFSKRNSLKSRVRNKLSSQNVLMNQSQ